MTEGDRNVIRRLFVFLEDRNVLTVNPLNVRNPDHIVQSVDEIRHELVDTAQRLTDDSPAARALLAMRKVCARYLHAEAAKSPTGLALGLGLIQGVIASEARTLAELYALKLPDNLRSPTDEHELAYLESGAVRLPSGRQIDPASGETRTLGSASLSWELTFDALESPTEHAEIPGEHADGPQHRD